MCLMPPKKEAGTTRKLYKTARHLKTHRVKPYVTIGTLK